MEIQVLLTIPRDSDFEKIKKIVKDVADEHRKILPNVPAEEKDIITKILELPNMRMLFKNKLDMGTFEPRILISEISDSWTKLA